MSRDEKPKAVVIDNGCGSCKAGFSGEEDPTLIVPSIVGSAQGSAETFVGEKAQSRADIQRRYPIDRGVVTNWEDMEKIWENIYTEMRVVSKDHPALLTEAPLLERRQKEKMTEIFFETFQVPSLFLGNQAALSMCVTGRQVGVVLDSGDGVTYAVPIVDGLAVKSATVRADFGGQDITSYLARLISDGGWHATEPTTLDSIRDMKERLCYVAGDFQTEVSSTVARKQYHMRDGHVVTLDKERIRTPEVLFQPSLINMDVPGIHTMIHEAIKKSDENIRKRLFGNIVLAGGNIMFEGLEPRLEKEMIALADPGTQAKTNCRPNRRYMAWAGGSLFASLPVIGQMSVSKRKFEEHGMKIIHKKFP